MSDVNFVGRSEALLNEMLGNRSSFKQYRLGMTELLFEMKQAVKAASEDSTRVRLKKEHDEALEKFKEVEGDWRSSDLSLPEIDRTVPHRDYWRYYIAAHVLPVSVTRRSGPELAAREALQYTNALLKVLEDEGTERPTSSHLAHQEH